MINPDQTICFFQDNCDDRHFRGRKGTPRVTEMPPSPSDPLSDAVI